MLLKTISGYTSLKKYLLKKDKTLQSTLLFTGPSGSASLPLALAYATHLHCTNPSFTDACGVCKACIKMARFTHPDLHFAFPIGTTQSVKGKDVTTTNFLFLWRQFLLTNPYGNLQDWSKQLQDKAKSLQIGKSQASYIKQIAGLKPFESNYTLVLIWLPELLNESASHALLKTLEEPAHQSVFMLVSDDPTQILATIHSRCLEVYVPRFSDEAMLETLKKSYPTLTSEECITLAKLADGDFNRAQKLAQAPVLTYFEKFAKWLRAVYTQHWTRLVKFAEDFYNLPLQVQKNWLLYGLEIMRATLLVHFRQAQLAQLHEKELSFCKKLASALTYNQIMKIIQALEKSHYALQRNANSKLLLLSISSSISTLIQNAKNH